MTRIRLPVGRTLFFVAVFLLSLAALLPLRLALAWTGLDRSGLSAREASGSAWLGALQEARVGPVPLGDVRARIGALPLLVGRARLAVSGGQGIDGAATVSRHGFGIDDASGTLRAAALFAPLPLSTIELDGLSARFAGGLCTQAEGSVRATFAGPVAGIPVASALAGEARCAEGALLLPLAGQSGIERLDLRLFPDGRWRADLAVPGRVVRFGGTF